MPTPETEVPAWYNEPIWKISVVILIIVVVGVIVQQVTKRLMDVFVTHCCGGEKNEDHSNGGKIKRLSKKWRARSKRKWMVQQFAETQENEGGTSNASENVHSDDEENEVDYISMRPLQSAEADTKSLDESVSNDGSTTGKTEHSHVLSKNEVFEVICSTKDREHSQAESNTNLTHKLENNNFQTFITGRENCEETIGTNAVGHYQNRMGKYGGIIAKSQTMPCQKRSVPLSAHELADAIPSFSAANTEQIQETVGTEDYAILNPMDGHDISMSREMASDSHFMTLQNWTGLDFATSPFKLSDRMSNHIYSNTDSSADQSKMLQSSRCHLVKSGEQSETADSAFGDKLLSQQSFLARKQPKVDRVTSAYRSYYEIDDIEPGCGYQT